MGSLSGETQALVERGKYAISNLCIASREDMRSIAKEIGVWRDLGM